MSDREDNDSDAPEEFTFDQGAKIDKEIRKVQIENRTRAVREKKESRRESNLKWAEKLTPRPSGKGQNAKDAVEAEVQESMGNEGMLPNDIVCILHKIDLKSG